MLLAHILQDLAIWLANSVNYVTEDGDEVRGRRGWRSGRVRTDSSHACDMYSSSTKCMDTEEAEAVMQQAIDLATTASVDPESVGDGHHHTRFASLRAAL